MCLIEWKTSKRRKATLDSTFDNPLQIVAYMGAVDFAEEYDVKVRRCTSLTFMHNFIFVMRKLQKNYSGCNTKI